MRFSFRRDDFDLQRKKRQSYVSCTNYLRQQLTIRIEFQPLYPQCHCPRHLCDHHPVTFHWAALYLWAMNELTVSNFHRPIQTMQ